MTKNRGKKREKKNERKMDEMLWWINASRQRNVAEGARVSVTLVGGYRNDIRESRVESSDGVEHGTVSLVENLYKYHGVGMEIEMGMGMKQAARAYINRQPRNSYSQSRALRPRRNNRVLRNNFTGIRYTPRYIQGSIVNRKVSGLSSSFVLSFFQKWCTFAC